jgi:hypothetical protein
MTSESKKLIPLTKWNQYHPWPSIGGLRHLVTNAKQKKFDKVIVRAGGRVLIDEIAFFEWATNPKNMGGGNV